MSNVRLYDHSDMMKIDWESKLDGLYIKSYTKEMLEKGSTYYISNVQVNLYLLEVDDLIFPITLPLPSDNQSYVVSPYTQYVLYTIEELKELKAPLLERVLKVILHLVGSILKKGKVDQVVIVNNWLLSTNLYNEISKDKVEAILIFLKERFPHHAIIFRSLTSYFHKDMMENFSELCFKLIPSRSIYIFDPKEFRNLGKRHRKQINQDLNFLQNSEYQVLEHHELTLDDLKRIRELYNMLYLEKYSYYNPQFTEEFFMNAWERNLLHFRALKKDGVIKGVVGFFTRNGVMTTPILGYDTAVKKEEGLYKLCSVLLTQHSLAENIILHRSAGAGKFKRNRGASNTIEYSAVYYKHLSKRKQLVWSFLSRLLNQIGLPILKKFEL